MRQVSGTTVGELVVPAQRRARSKRYQPSFRAEYKMTFPQGKVMILVSVIMESMKLPRDIPFHEFEELRFLVV